MHSKTDGPADNVTICFFPSGRKKKKKKEEKKKKKKKTI